MPFIEHHQRRYFSKRQPDFIWLAFDSITGEYLEKEFFSSYSCENFCNNLNENAGKSLTNK